MIDRGCWPVFAAVGLPDHSPPGPIGISLLNPFEDTLVPFGDWIEGGVDWLGEHCRWLFQALRWPINLLLGQIETLFQTVPPLIVVAIVALIAWQLAGRRIALFSVGCLVAIGAIGAWEASMTTLALVMTAVVLCVGVGLPLGIWAARNDRVEALLRPGLAGLQTLPPFVYLVPVVLLLGTGRVPGVVATVLFALPPLIRSTTIALRQVPAAVVEAAHAFGATPQQILWDVTLPLALPMILAGVHQALGLALSMVVFGSLIGVVGLGQMVYQGIGGDGGLDGGLAAVGGLGLVLLAMLLDRMTQAVGQPGATPELWLSQGPIGGLRRLFRTVQAHQARKAQSGPT
ncbi:MAG: ABC transporter permease [Prochlorothrix sp.]